MRPYTGRLPFLGLQLRLAAGLNRDAGLCCLLSHFFPLAYCAIFSRLLGVDNARRTFATSRGDQIRSPLTSFSGKGNFPDRRIETSREYGIFKRSVTWLDFR